MTTVEVEANFRSTPTTRPFIVRTAAADRLHWTATPHSLGIAGADVLEMCTTALRNSHALYDVPYPGAGRQVEMTPPEFTHVSK
jgi:hypothetical protein